MVGTLKAFNACQSPRCVIMPRAPALYPLCREFQQHPSSLPSRLRRVLALWLKGMLPTQTDAALYACLHWIELGLLGCKQGGWQWQRMRRRDPVRVAWHVLMPAVATLLAVA